jgi:quercetin dioxygenase-like cupin family protein
MSNDEHASDRTRVHPDTRFAPPAQEFDLDAVARELSRERGGAASPQGHRQKTLYRHGNSTLALFLFDAGGGMREHRASGTVFIQVLEGRLTVNAQGQRHELVAGRVLVMAPGVVHDVRAEEPARMLLTVCLQPAATAAAGPDAQPGQ